MARAATFTTYINTKTDGSIESAFDRLQSVAVSRYATISRAATEAGKASAGLLGGGGSAGLGAQVTKGLTDRARAITQVNAAATGAIRSSDAYVAKLERESVAARGAARNNEALARSLQTTAKALNVVQGPLGPLAGRVGALANAVQSLTGFRLGLVGVAATLFSLGKLGNTYAQLQGRLRPFFDTQQQANKAFGDVVGIANRSRSAIEPVIGLYTRLKASADDLGVSQSRILRATEIAAKAATLSGGSGETQQAGLGQFAQGIGSNNLGGDELKSIKENIPVLAQAIAKGFKNADGSIGTTVGNLKKLGSEGKLSAAIILDALDRSSRDIETKFARLPVTLSSAAQQFGNAFLVQVGKFDQATGLTRTLAGGLSLVADNLRVVTALAVGAGVAFAGLKLAPTISTGVSGLVATFTALQREAELKRGTALLDRQFALQDAQDAQTSVRNTQARIAAIQAENAAIAESVVELRAKAAAEAEAVAAARTKAYGPGGTANPSRFTLPSPVNGLAAAEGETRAILRLRTAAEAEAAASAARTGASSTALAASVKAVADAEAQAVLTTRALATAESELAGTTAALNAEQKLLAVQNGAATVTMASANAVMARTVPTASLLSTGLAGLRSAGSSIVALFGGPWGIALAAAAAAMYLLATAESAAEIATRKNEDAQRAFEAQVDRTTGKVYGQIGSLELLAKAKVQADAARANVDTAKQKGNAVLQTLNPFLAGAPQQRFKTVNGFRVPVAARDTRTDAQRELAGAVENFRQGKAGSLPALNDAVTKLAPKINGLTAALPRVGNALGDFRTQLRGGIDSGGKEVIGVRQSTARVRVLTGKARPGDVARAFGEDDKGAGDGSVAARPKAAALDRQADAAAKANSGVQIVAAQGRATQALLDLRKKYDAGGLTPADYQQQRQQIKESSALEIQGIKDSAKAARTAAAEGRADKRKGLAQAKKDLAEEAREAKKTQIEINQTKREDAGTKKTAALTELEGRDLAPQSDEYLNTRLKILQTYDDEVNAIDSTKTKSHEAADQQLKDAKARQKPFDDILLARQREVQVDSLLLAGREAEADALRTSYGLIDQVGRVTQAQYDTMVAQNVEAARTNDLLESRQRITSLIKGTVDQARDSFETFLTDIQTGKGVDIGNLFKQAKDGLFRIEARKVTESLFAGADEKVRGLLSGKSKTDLAVDSFAGTINRSDSALDKLATSFENAATRFDTSSPGLTTGGAIAGAGAAGAIPPIASIVALGNAAVAGTTAANDNRLTNAPVTAAAPLPVTLAPLPGGKEIGSSVFGGVFKGADKLVDLIKGTPKNAGSLPGGVTATNSKFFQGIGNQFSKALAGAGQGEFASGIAKAVGIKQSAAGAQIGGAIGGLTGIPGAGFIGGLIGGTLGGLLKKVKFGTAQVSLNQFGAATGGTGTGNDKATAALATGQASSIAQGINQIAKQLGATITNLPALTVGSFDGKARVALTSTTKSLNYNNFNADTLKNFDDDQQAAIEYAIRYSIGHAVINGISQASKNIINAGGDLQAAIEKAIAIESIPKRLLAITDPTKYAIDNLNYEFTQLINNLKEGGATAEQFSDAQKLYDISRKNAIEQATNQAVSQIDAYLKEMNAGSTSPLNKRTTYQNAAGDLNLFRSEINSGKIVDQSALLAAAKNFQDASRGLYGSSESFFADFNSLRDLLSKARDNASIYDVSTLPGLSTGSTATGATTITTGTGASTSTSTVLPSLSTLPASPFTTDPAVVAILKGNTTDQISAINAQTAALLAKLGQVVGAVDDLAGLAANNNVGSLAGKFGLLPGYAFNY